jgi:predicted  nucleic acid-binding Zn-ribbon protein
MATQSESVAQDRTATSDGDQLEFAGQAILNLLHKAASTTEANSRQALATAQKLSSQLRSAEHRIEQLEAEIQHYREKSERAEAWLRKISTEVENRLF